MNIKESSGVWVFFYGTFMNPKILAEYSIIPNEVILAKLNGYELYIRPRVNLKRVDSSCVYGALMPVTLADLRKLYKDLDERFGLEYVPESVFVETPDGGSRSALCYLTTNMKDELAKKEYVGELAKCVREAGFPESYVAHIKSFG